MAFVSFLHFLFMAVTSSKCLIWRFNHFDATTSSAEILFLPVKVCQRFHGDKGNLEVKNLILCVCVCIPTVPHVSPPQFLSLSVSEGIKMNGNTLLVEVVVVKPQKNGTKMCLKYLKVIWFWFIPIRNVFGLGCGLKFHIPILREMFEKSEDFFTQRYFCFEKTYSPEN